MRGGMLGLTFFGIFLTPVFYYVIQWFAETSNVPKPAPTEAAGHPAYKGIHSVFWLWRVNRLPRVAMEGVICRMPRVPQCDAGGIIQQMARESEVLQ